jgi:ABC-type bacteriocin/lantibiotic exporter with double-glycine peptidase domain
MGIRLFKKVGLVAWLVFGLLWTNIAFARVLNVPQKYQEQSNWCWAASSQAILEYYKTKKTQTEIAQYGTEGLNTWNWLSGSSPHTSTDPLRNGIDLILQHFAKLATDQRYTFLSQAQVQSEIDARRPFVIYWQWDSGGGHFVVAKGIDGNLVTLMNPAAGTTLNAYDWVRRGSSHTWTDSLTLKTSPPANLTAIIYLLLAD